MTAVTSRNAATLTQVPESSADLLPGRLRGHFQRWLAGPSGRHPWLAWMLLGVAYILLNTLLVPTASYSYDEVGLVGAANDWLRWGLPLFNSSKVGIDVPVLGLLAEALAHTIRLTGLVSGVAAIHIAYKLPLLLANVGTAVSLGRLARRFGFRHSQMVAVLWLFNPVSFWVAAGHGQIECLSVFTAVGSFDLLLSGWPVAAGVLCALGAAVEYFPLAVAAAAVFLVAHRRLGFGAFGRYLAALLAGLAACFGPLLTSSILRAGTLAAFSGGVTPTHVANAAPPSPWGFSVWSLFPSAEIPPTPALASVSLLLVAGVFVVATIAVRRGTCHPERVACGTVGLLLVLTVIVNPITNPQYALIAGGGLFLFTIAFGLSIWAAAFIPLAGLLTYLIYESPWVFFYDLWGQRAVHLPQLPVSSLAAVFLARVFTIGSLVVVAWTVAIQLRRRQITLRDPGGHKRFGLLLGTSLVGCSILASLGAVPAFWSAVAPGGPVQPIDFNGFIAVSPQDTVLTPNILKVRYPRLLFHWASGASLKPSSEVEVVPTSLFVPPRSTIAMATPTSRWPQIRLSVPTGQVRGSLWVRLLVGSPSWTSPSAPSLTNVTFLANGRPVRASSVAWSTPTWATVNLLIPDTILGSSGMLTLRAPPVVDKWDTSGLPARAGGAGSAGGPVFVGAGRRPWEPIINVLPGTGSFHAPVNGTRWHLHYSTSVTGAQTPVATISGFPVTSRFELPRSAVPFGITSVLTAGLHWPPAAPFRHREMLLVTGCAWAVVLAVLGLFAILSFRRMAARR